MQYRTDKYGNSVSVLGYGCMRFTQNAGKIDIKKAEQEIMEAYRGGVNYYDTAYIYPGSEAALGEILERNHIRDKVYIATKLPHYMVRKPEGFEKFFAEELRRLRTDRVDYYLIHMMNDIKAWERLVELGILPWLAEKKKSGQIRQLGFSYHGNSDMFCQVIDAYDWDFCQIQYNYLDEYSQAGVTGLHYAAEKGLPVVIMEPLRGGKLVKNLPQKAKQLMQKHSVSRSPAEWGFRWLWNQKEITCVLSGMNSLEMVKENVRSADESRIGELTEADFDLLRQVVEIINANQKVGCTGCRYCMPCPKGVDIPGIFAAYNRKASDGGFQGLWDYMKCVGIRRDYTGPGNCIGCGKCEQHCPQHIAVRTELKNAKKALETPLFKTIHAILPKIMKY